ncbi:hypothetical protein SEUCBS139899_004969 [Sporothrix eucalyptigena]|uniref:NADH dehydrogenase [ubiquinone] 1 beta subcomplex subunit 11, mitochondrial n=1 Tax=Sporothrix eucalyptigena TaxID=1812306 RepID=A0ABP0AMZ3_9PEZI
MSSIAASAAKRALAKSSASTAAAVSRRTFTSTVRRQGGHGSQYDPPSGWLFGVKPGEKYKNEGWEKTFFWGFCGSLIVFACVIPFKPDTSIQTWALEEARRRLEAEGILKDPFPESK